ncbi:MAG: CcmD family protein [Myxococcota bacterium]|jgi:CcmD family protein
MLPLRRMALAISLVVACLVVAAPVASAQEQGTEPSAFEAMDPETSRHKENLSGIPFMVGAYMAIWASLFGYLGLLYKRQSKTDAEIAELVAALKAHDQLKAK